MPNSQLNPAADIPQSVAAELMLGAIAGPARDGDLFEVRRLLANGRCSRRWFPVRERHEAAAYAICESRRGNVYAGALTRFREGGSAADTEQASILWIDHDRPDEREALRPFHRPSIVVETGTEGHLLCIWQLRSPVPTDQAREANLRLAHHLHGDTQACDAAKVLRLPATLNHKTSPPRAVRCTYLECHAYAVEELLADVPALPEPPRPPRPRRAPDRGADDPLLSVAAAEYVPLLTGRELGRDGKVSCPFHGGGQERTPSLHAYDDPDGGWYCYGCGEGGDIYTFAARLWHTETRGAAFPELRRRLASELLRTEAAA